VKPSLSSSGSLLLLAILAVAVSMGMLHRVMLASDFLLVQSSVHDTRFNHYILEHEVRWLRGDDAHARFWDLPVFYPSGTNALAYSDTLLSFLPPYAAARASGLNPETSYQAWLLCITLANVLAAIAFFRFVARAPPLASTLGALLFCVVAPRMMQFDHHQLYPQFWMLLAAAAVVRILRDGIRADAPAFTVWPSVAALALALQAWGGFYVMYFTGFALGLGALVGLALPAGRAAMFGAVRRSWPSFLIAAVLFVALVAPLALRYHEALGQVGARPYASVADLLPRVQSWLFAGPSSRLWGWTSRWACFQELPFLGEHVMGPGYFTVAAAAAGVWLRRRDAYARWLVLLVAVLVLVTTSVAGHSLWRLIYEAVPGGSGIRAVTRFWLITILPVSLGVAAVVAHLERSGRWILALLVGAACVGEQWVGGGVGYDKVEQRQKLEIMARTLRPASQAFFVTSSADVWAPQVSIEAMWVGLASGRPTLNGYSGNAPPGHDLLPVARNEAELLDAWRRLEAWCANTGLDRRRIDWIHDGRRIPFDEAPAP
jgi:hypothetical protein